MNSSTTKIKRDKRILLEKYIEESMKQYDFLFTSDADAIYVMDLDGYMIALNPSCERVFGYTPEQLATYTYMKLLTLEHLDRGLSFFYKALEGKLQNFDCQVFHKNGMLVDLNITNYPIVVKDEIVGVYGVARDITEIKRNRRNMQEQESYYQLLTENSLDILTRSTIDGKFLFVSSYCEELIGYTASELIGRDITDFIHDDDLDRVVETRKIVFNGRGNGRVSFRIKHRFGYYIWFETLCRPIFDEKNRVSEIISVFRDISERKKAEEEIENREKTYRDIVEHSPDAVVIAKHDCIVFSNQTAIKLLGATNKADLIGKNIFEFIHPDYINIVKQHVKISESGNKVDFIEEKLIGIDGNLIDVEVTTIPAIYENEPARHIIIRDVTEKKRTQQLLLQSEKLSAAGKLAAGIAHEIRNPLTAIKGFLQLIEKNDYDLSYMNIIKTEMNRIEDILSELLLLSKPQNMKFEKENLKKILNHIKTLIDTQAIMNNIEIDLAYLSDIPEIICDTNQLKQVFINLLKNALEAMPQGGKIKIEVEGKDKESIVIRIIDQGCGIPEANIKRLGQPFFTTKENGTGLGLMISMQIIENHQGSITFSSNQNGTTVEISLPVANT
jgi:PAS domain S-box-containing protein